MQKPKLLLLAAAVNGLSLGGIADVQAKPVRHLTKDAQIEALTRRLEQLEKRLEESEARQASPAGRKLAEAESPAVKQLDQKVKVLERKLEVEKEVTAEAAKKTPKLEAGPEGVRFTSPEGDHVIRLRGSVQTDGKFYMDDNQQPSGASGSNLADTFQLRQARIGIEGTLFKYFGFRVTPDFGKGQTFLQYADLDYHQFDFASLNVGKQKTPISLERLQGDTNTNFLERAYPTQLASNRDVGVMLHGEFAKPGQKTVYDGPVGFKDFISYQLGVFNGSGDNNSGSDSVDLGDNKEFAGRVFAQPFQHSGIEVLDGLGIGIGGSWEQPKKQSLANLTSANGQNTIVSYSSLGGSGSNKTTSLTADHDHYRVYPQVYWYYGPFGLMGEYVLSSQQLLASKSDGSSTRVTQNNSAWQVQASYVVTGEDNSFHGVKPRQAFDPLNGHWGALQLVARWHELDIDDDTYQAQTVNGRPFQLLDPSKSVSSATSWTLGGNWFLNRNTLIRADYEQTYYDGGAAKGRDRPTEKIFSTRFQLAF